MSGDAGRQVVVQQDGAGIEILQAQAAALAHQRLDREGLAIGQAGGGLLVTSVSKGAQAHVQVRPW